MLYLLNGDNVLYVQNGGDICRHHQTTGSTALHMACSRGHYHIVSYILKVSKIHNYLTSLESESCVKQWDINAVDLQGQTALQVAAEKGLNLINLFCVCTVVNPRGGRRHTYSQHFR